MPKARLKQKRIPRRYPFWWAMQNIIIASFETNNTPLLAILIILVTSIIKMDGDQVFDLLKNDLIGRLFAMLITGVLGVSIAGWRIKIVKTELNRVSGEKNKLLIELGAGHAGSSEE